MIEGEEGEDRVKFCSYIWNLMETLYEYGLLGSTIRCTVMETLYEYELLGSTIRYTVMETLYEYELLGIDNTVYSNGNVVRVLETDPKVVILINIKTIMYFYPRSV